MLEQSRVPVNISRIRETTATLTSRVRSDRAEFGLNIELKEAGV